MIYIDTTMAGDRLFYYKAVSPICAGCGWTSRPGEAIPCADAREGPFYCPRCHRPLETHG